MKNRIKCFTGTSWLSEKYQSIENITKSDNNFASTYADLNKLKYTGYDIGFDCRSQFLLTNGSYGKNVIIFKLDMSPSVDVDNKEKDMLILGEGTTQRLDDTTLTAEPKYPINFTQSDKKICNQYTL